MAEGNGRPISATFTGDLGRRRPLLLREPAPIPAANLLVCESTYGGRTLDPVCRAAKSLEAVVRATAERGGKVLIPATLPWIFIGMRIAVRYAFTNTLLAELIASNRGIGFMIEYYSGVFDATGTYAAILVQVIMSVALTELLTQIEARMSHRGETA